MKEKIKTRIDTIFEGLASQKKAGLAVYLTAGYPNVKFTTEALLALPKANVDIIELGFPFSDPVADGEIIQETSKISIKKGMNLKKVIKLVYEFRKKNNYTPIILMGYYNPILTYGLEKFAKDARSAGIDGLIIVDLPIEEDDEFLGYLNKNSVQLIRLVTPTTSKTRLKLILKKSSGCLYYVSTTGITGSNLTSERKLKQAYKMISSKTSLPVMIGFGIKTAKDFQICTKYFDCGVVGSQALTTVNDAISSGKDPLLKLKEYCIKLSKTVA